MQITQANLQGGLIRFYQKRLIDGLREECIKSVELDDSEREKVMGALQLLSEGETLDLVENGLTQTVRLPDKLGQMQSLKLVKKMWDGTRNNQSEEPIGLKKFAQFIQHSLAKERIMQELKAKYFDNSLLDFENMKNVRSAFFFLEQGQTIDVGENEGEKYVRRPRDLNELLANEGKLILVTRQFLNRRSG